LRGVSAKLEPSQHPQRLEKSAKRRVTKSASFLLEVCVWDQSKSWMEAGEPAVRIARRLIDYCIGGLASPKLPSRARGAAADASTPGARRGIHEAVAAAQPGRPCF
jgi:hypothetical protein